MTRVIFVVDFCHLVTKNKMGCDLFKGLFRKRRPKITIFWGKQKLNFPYLDHNQFLFVASIMRGLKKNLLSSLTCSQNWLSSLVDDCQFTNLTKFGDISEK
jgi:hypothetical protein